MNMWTEIILSGVVTGLICLVWQMYEQNKSLKKQVERWKNNYSNKV